MEDASLDEFVSDSDEGDDPSGDGGDDRPSSDSSESTTTDAVEPATPTSRWNHDGVACDACGETVQRRWRSDGQYVCRSCKEW